MSAQVRLRLDIAYDGTQFSGWARQPGLRTVQGELEAALAMVLRTSEPVELTVAGRTDAGVHARGQVAHLDIPSQAWHSLPGRAAHSPAQALVRRVNGILARRGAQAGVLRPSIRGAGDVLVRSALLAPEGFDARFSALRRRYAYRISDLPAPDSGGQGAHHGSASGWRDPLRRADVLWHDRYLDVGAMDEAAALLIGEHDFAAFCKPRAGATTIRELQVLRWRRSAGTGGEPEGMILADVRADAFCHSMVRALVGACLAVGEGRADRGWPAQILSAQVRDSAVHVAPAHGLTLEEVSYPDDEQLAARVALTRRRRDE